MLGLKLQQDRKKLEIWWKKEANKKENVEARIDIVIKLLV
jgi:hypothetical protein